jgi:hypothetical protein
MQSFMQTGRVDISKINQEKAESKRNKEKKEPYASLHEDLLPLL